MNPSPKGVFLDDLKEALVKALLANLDLVDKNYRPVSNLAFAGKLIEGVVVDQPTDHIHNHRLMESLKSAYRAFNSTKTALLKVRSYIHLAMDKQEVICLVLPDLSAAFDTVDHSNLLNQLNHCF